MRSGWIVLDKPLGLGSTQAVGAVKRALHEAGESKTKVGHGGTLDPLATGVLPVALGEATKLAGRMLDSTKSYDFTICFGEETDTLDAEGSVIATSDSRPAREEIEAILAQFTGPIAQIPPAYSALKVSGQRAYDLARKGEDVALCPRLVSIHQLALLTMSGEKATLAATVSKGTYIRSLARDIARAVGTVGHVAMLRRTRAGPFGLDRAISLDKMMEFAKARSLDEVVLPLEAGLDDIPALRVTPEQATLLRHGQQLVGISAQAGLHLAREAGTPVALVEVAGGQVTVVRGFNI